MPHDHGSHCECRACTCDCGTYQYEPMEKCHPDCTSNTVGGGRLSDNCLPPAYEYRITHF
ncbi:MULTISPECIES: hypothetical protein [Streptomyces]|uniref:Uncharacterized protein n=1 Tax=Streptomyces clavifer TaxID=68188 RepID=A0ABS4VHF8_9ACTN|nr:MULTISPECIES: hypothetical protein [Streptomyces]MBP2363358.1 hypothetical protein [Streptomyces clavifer]MDX2748504.1 hypothetical protein [Streptomyces sp. NRRL_B-2557]GHB30843.1 hypothetical protein GCM10010392_68590 [Streptomyces clavifer]